MYVVNYHDGIRMDTYRGTETSAFQVAWSLIRNGYTIVDIYFKGVKINKNNFLNRNKYDAQH